MSLDEKIIIKIYESGHLYLPNTVHLENIRKVILLRRLDGFKLVNYEITFDLEKKYSRLLSECKDKKKYEEYKAIFDRIIASRGEIKIVSKCHRGFLIDLGNNFASTYFGEAELEQKNGCINVTYLRKKEQKEFLTEQGQLTEVPNQDMLWEKYKSRIRKI